MNHPRLERCPFCGRDNAEPDGNEPVFCAKCGARGPLPFNLGPRDAAARWNRRVSYLLPEDVEALRRFDDWMERNGLAVITFEPGRAQEGVAMLAMIQETLRAILARLECGEK